MARYCDAKDLRALIPDTFRDAALADSNGGGEADAGLLNAVLEGACNEVDALIEGRVRLPLESVPSKLRVAAANIALELLYIRRGRELPAAAADKVQWWRGWLSKVGEGELRLDAPDTAGKTEYPGAVATRPSVTGSGRLLFGWVTWICALAFAHDVLAVGPRAWAFDVPDAEDVFENPAEMEWAAGESLELRYAGGSLAAGQEARWEVGGGTNLWISLEGAEEGGAWRWSLAPTQSCLPAGRYSGRVAVYDVEEGETAFLRVAALQSIQVHRGNEGLAELSPVRGLLADYATREWAEGVHAAIARDVATNAAAIAALEEAAEGRTADIGELRGATNALDGAVGALRDDLTAASNAIPSVAGLASEEWVVEYVQENSPPPDLTPYVVKTNGAWVICLGTAWNGIEWDGERIFGAVLEVGTNGTAEITGLEVAATNRLVLSFRGAATNALEACADMTNWTVWADGGGEYEGETWGRVTVSNASPAYWYRVAALGAVPAWSNAAVVSYAPLYAGSVAASNRVATMADVERKAGPSPRGIMVGYMRSTARETSMVPGEAETNAVLWSFNSNESYVKDLTVGGKVVEWEEVVEEGGTTVTNLHSATNAGSMTFNGQEIHSWAEIAQYASNATVTVEAAVESVNGLTNAVTIAGGTNASVRTEGQTVYVDVEGGGVGSINGLTGDFLIVNGAGISVETNTIAGFQVVTISATGGGGGGGSGNVDTNAIVSAALAAAGTNDWASWTIGGVTRNAWAGGGTFEPAWRVVTETNATVLATDYLIWLDGSATGANLGSDDEMVLDLPDMATESQTVVVRRLGNTGEVKLRRVSGTTTNTYALGSDGSAVAADWVGARTNWWWRQAY